MGGAMNYNVRVEIEVEVNIDEALFTKEVMEGFNEVIHNRGLDTGEHAKHIARMFANGCYVSTRECFEGYGVLNDVGVKVRLGDEDAFLIEQDDD